MEQASLLEPHIVLLLNLHLSAGESISSEIDGIGVVSLVPCIIMLCGSLRLGIAAPQEKRR